MGASITGLDASYSIDVFDASQLFRELRDLDEAPKAGEYGISSRDSEYGSGYAITGTAAELFDWLTRARDELARRVDADRAAAGTAVDCGECGAKAGVECEHQYCTGRLDPAVDAGVDDEDLDAVIRFEEAVGNTL